IEKDLEAKFLGFQLLLSVVGALSITLVYGAFWLSGSPSALIYLLIAFVGGLTGLELPLLMRMLQQKSEFSRLISSALALDNLGCFFASLIFPMLMLPKLGLMRTAMLTATLN